MQKANWKYAVNACFSLDFYPHWLYAYPVYRKLFNLSAKFSTTPASIDAPPPTLGQHQQEILGQLGYTVEEIKAMKEKAAI
ncbi:hypothetical protein HY768_06985 [candidate division TA06 bacterium]|uniref:CoA transferase n=1 Tax=candidate division TA06 bacterium TaxID=2250710 RepID=A0A933ICR7_UNCT6|nr:hypothetical protein [candidate division TA06 bacterium]